MTLRIAVIPGDGVGPEVVPAGASVVDAAFDATGRPRVAWQYLPWGSNHFLEHGRMMPSDALEVLGEHDAIYLGAIGSPLVPDHVTVWDTILPIRQTFQQFVNVRPARLLPGIASPLAGDPPIDIVCIRENTEGEYAHVGGRVHRGLDNEVAIQTGVFTRAGVRRVAEYAFTYARMHGRRTVASATKSNAWAYSMTLWDEVVAEVAAQHSDIDFQKFHVDALAARYVTAPETLDVVVCSNLFGDILSDLGAGLVGGLGVVGSANIDPSGRSPSMFEPVHGSAPDIASTGRANPFGAVWAASLMLEHLGLNEEARLVIDALEWAALSPQTRTPDVAGTGTTDSVAAAIAERTRAGVMP